MSLKLHHHHIVSPSSSDPRVCSFKPLRSYNFSRKVIGLNHLLLNRCCTRKRFRIKISLLEHGKISLSCRSSDLRKCYINFRKSKRMEHLLPFASADDGVTVNGSPLASSSDDVEEMRIKLNQSLQGEDLNTGLVQSLHDAARVVELAIRNQSSLSKSSWFSTAWLGVDRTAWLKALSYQASVYSLLQAVIEISSRGDGRDKDVNIFVQKSLSRQSAGLETMVKDKLLAKQPEVFDCFWNEEIPAVVASFIDSFEKDQRFAAATAIFGKSSVSGNASDTSLLMLALSCIAAVTKLGPTKVSCAPFFSIIPDTTGRLMDKLLEFIPLRQVYHSMKDIGLRREFLVHFGGRASDYRVKTDQRTEEVIFWIDLIQKQLQRAIDRERIWSRLTTCESIEVLERDLAIFGFFIALGRSTQSYLSANGFDAMEEPLEGFIRYLIGGSVLYYPQLSSISSYQLYVEVVCEELDWLPLYPGSCTAKQTVGHKSKREGPPNAEAIPFVLDVCSHWIQSFIKYSKWLENPSNVKAATFLSKGHEKLKICMEELGTDRTRSGNYSQVQKEPDSFDKALESVEDALIRLEELLQELHMSSSNSGKEHLKAACSDLERIRKLKKEAEFLEASFRAKAASLQQGDDLNRSPSSVGKQIKFRGKEGKASGVNQGSNSRVSNSGGLWSFLASRQSRSSDLPLLAADGSDDDYFEQTSATAGLADSESNEIQRFELLRNELMELEKRVQKSADQSQLEEEEIQTTGNITSFSDEGEDAHSVKIQKKDNIIGKSLDKLKETSTDVLQGTQLLAIDVAAALGLLRRAMIGDEITDKEKQALRRTLTDLASVVPIGILMLLPVTAVGHAAMLAAIQRYVPSLIPSTYGPERLDLLRQLEKVKEMEQEVKPVEAAEEPLK